jgi:polysaccharide biosynthesis/export protein
MAAEEITQTQGSEGGPIGFGFLNAANNLATSLHMFRTKMHTHCSRLCMIVLAVGVLGPRLEAQEPKRPPQAERIPETQPGNALVAASTPAGYIVGADDLLTIRFWADPQLSADVVVRPDGKISIPLLNDVQAAGLTPQQLGESLEKAASKFVTVPTATVIVREIRSRKVFLLGPGIAKQGVVPLTTEMTVLQAIAAAGGLLEYAHKDDVVILRTENGQEKRFKFNFDDVTKGKNLKQNILLQPNDTILVK